jgi:SAM-dependent methyltransferase
MLSKLLGACCRSDVVDTAELQLLTSLEDHHWWYKERRAILSRELRQLPGPGRALDIGAAGGGNTRVLKAHGWQAIALEYSDSTADVARSRGIWVMRADARQLPIRSGTCGLVTAFDVLEHIDEDYLAAAEIARVLQPGGTALIAVPCDMALWSAHDDAVGHVRRYSRPELTSLIQKAGLTVESIWSWNVLLRPAVAMRRKSSTGSDLGEVPPVTNGLLTAVVVAERYLPVKSWPGVSLMLRARRPLPRPQRPPSPEWHHQPVSGEARGPRSALSGS